MKITGIDIKEYQQFKDLKFDFTYPKGHPKEGQPMDKVCFIGQSGTGKTTLLEFFSDVIKSFNSIDVLKEVKIKENFKGIINLYFEYWNKNLQLDNNYKDIKFDWKVSKEKDNLKAIDRQINEITYQLSREFSDGEAKRLKEILEILKVDKKEITDKISIFNSNFEVSLCIENTFQIFLKSNISEFINEALNSKQSILFTEKRAITTEHDYEKELLQNSERVYSFFQKKNYIFDNQTEPNDLFYLLHEIEAYDTKIKRELSDIIQNNLSSIEQFTSLQDKIKDSKPRITIGNKINPILKKFFVEIDSNVSEYALLVIKRNSDNLKLPPIGLSTGTKQILSTSLPLIQLNTKGTVILFDEPERSLFPDLQREIIDYYTGLAPDAQFFFATHSPIIAAAFEPCERFILYFDEEGNVKFRNGVAPIGDDPNDILSEDFEMSPLTNQKGVEAYQKWLDLANRIRHEKDEVKKEQLISERIKLGNLYNF